MNQGFRSRYDEMRDNDPAEAKKAEKVVQSTLYTGASHARSLCLILTDSKRYFLNYAYLISGEFEVHKDINVIRLNFAGYNVELSGYTLENLYMSMLEHVPRIISVIDSRYVVSLNADEPAVISIQVSPKD